MWNPIGKCSCSRPHVSFVYFPCFSRKKPNLFQTCPPDLDVLDAAVNRIASAWPHCSPILRDVCGKFLVKYCGLPPRSVCILFWNVLYLTGPNRCHYSTREEVNGFQIKWTECFGQGRSPTSKQSYFQWTYTLSAPLRWNWLCQVPVLTLTKTVICYCKDAHIHFLQRGKFAIKLFENLHRWHFQLGFLNLAFSTLVF